MKRGLVLLLALDCSVAYAQVAPPPNLSLLLALRSTLERHPLLQVQQQQVEISRAVVLRARSQFDPVFQSQLGHSRQYLPLTGTERAIFGTSSATINVTDLELRASQLLHNGITTDTTMDVNRTADALTTPFGLNQSHLAFTVTLPLLRGRGRDIVAAPETAAGVDVEASIFDLTQSISDLLSRTAEAYWSAVAAMRVYAVYQDAEARGRVYLETVQTLIDADRLPRSEISQVQGNLASRSAARLAAQQQLWQAKQQLAIAIGLRGDQMLMVPDPSDALPTAQLERLPNPDPSLMPLWIDQALARRADLLALRKRQNSANILRGAAENQFRPQMDLQLSTGYAGSGEGTRLDRYFAAPFIGVHGADVVGSIRYELPIGRRAAQASFMAADSTLRQAGYRIEEATRTITSEVIVTVDGVRNAAAQLRQIQLSVDYSRAALDNEREKLRLGVGSLLDVLTVEERLTNVLVFAVESELAYAVSLARLRSATGTIMTPGRTVQDIDPAVFFTLPETGTVPR